MSQRYYNKGCLKESYLQTIERKKVNRIENYTIIIFYKVNYFLILPVFSSKAAEYFHLFLICFSININKFLFYVHSGRQRAEYCSFTFILTLAIYIRHTSDWEFYIRQTCDWQFYTRHTCDWQF